MISANFPLITAPIIPPIVIVEPKTEYCKIEGWMCKEINRTDWRTNTLYINQIMHHFFLNNHTHQVPKFIILIYICVSDFQCIDKGNLISIQRWSYTIKIIEFFPSIYIYIYYWALYTYFILFGNCFLWVFFFFFLGNNSIVGVGVERFES